MGGGWGGWGGVVCGEGGGCMVVVWGEWGRVCGRVCGGGGEEWVGEIGGGGALQSSSPVAHNRQSSVDINSQHARLQTKTRRDL